MISRVKSQKLEKLLDNRPTKKELRKSEILSKSDVANSLAGNAKTLERNIAKDRLSQFVKSKDGKVNPNRMSASIQGTAKTLEFKVKGAKVNSLLKNRPEKDELRNSNVISGKGANAIQGTANTLVQKMKQNTLKKRLSQRPTKKEMEKNNIFGNNSTTANSLQGTATSLETKLKQNTLKRQLSLRPNKEELKKNNILNNSDTANTLQGTANTLVQKMKQNTLKKRLSQRPTKEEMEKNNILNIKTADALQGTANTLVQKMKQNTLKKRLSQRPTKEEMEKANLLGNNSTTANSLQGRANILQTKMKQATLKKQLSLRPNKEKLEKKQILKEFKTDLAPSLQANALILEKNLHKDRISLFLKTGERVGDISVDKKLKDFLENRPTKEELEKKQIIQNNSTAPSIQPTAKLLELRMKQNTLKKKLSLRSSRKSLTQKMILRELKEEPLPQKSAVHQINIPRERVSLYTRAGEKIGEVIIPDNLRSMLVSRSTKDDLEAREILPNRNAADSLQGTANVLEKQIRQNTIKKKLSKRPDTNTLKKNAVLKKFETNLATGLQGNATSLESNLSKDKMSLAMRNGQRVGEVTNEQKGLEFI